jgi:hypothetical protein
MTAPVFYAAASAELATLTNVFSVSDVATDPTTVTLTVIDPEGTSTTYTYAGSTITKTATGTYTKDIATTLAGIWRYTWTGTGTASDVVTGTWTVQPAAPVVYCTREEIKSRLQITDTTDDFEILAAVDAASRWVEEHCHRRFDRVTATRTYPAQDPYTVRIDDLVTLTTLATDADADGTYETTWDAADRQLLPANPSRHAETRPYDTIRAVGSTVFPLGYTWGQRTDLVQVTGTFGWPAVPQAVKSAAAILAADLYRLKDAPFGLAGYGDYGPVRIRENPRVTALLAPYRSTPVLVA